MCNDAIQVPATEVNSITTGEGGGAKSAHGAFSVVRDTEMERYRAETW